LGSPLRIRQFLESRIVGQWLKHWIQPNNHPNSNDRLAEYLAARQKPSSPLEANVVHARSRPRRCLFWDGGGNQFLEARVLAQWIKHWIVAIDQKSGYSFFL
jgi:hypothetical protein